MGGVGPRMADRAAIASSVAVVSLPSFPVLCVFAMSELLDRSSLFSSVDLSNVWYSVDQGGKVIYSQVGRDVYRPLFKEVGVDIQAISTVDEHKAAVQKVVGKRVADMKRGPGARRGRS